MVKRNFCGGGGGGGALYQQDTGRKPRSLHKLSAFGNRRVMVEKYALSLYSLKQCFSTAGPREVLLELRTNLNVILYLPTCHTIHIIVLILFMIMP